jgi:putative thioredoxin
MAIDVTDETFQTEVIARSFRQPVIVDLWAEWCGPCKTLGPIIEKVVDATNGRVALVKVDVDSNPQVAGAFQVQSIPAVFALQDGEIINTFVGALPEHEIQAFVDTLGPSQRDLQIQALLTEGTESSLLQALDLDAGNEAVIVALAQLWVDDGRSADALTLLARVPETDPVRKVAAAARLATRPPDDYDTQLTELLDQVKADEEARQRYVDILELMGPEDPRTAGFRKKLTSRLY